MSLVRRLSRYVKGSLAAICLAGLVGLESKLYSKDIYVPRDYLTIQAAIDAAEDGDRVLVAPGKYIVREPITFRRKKITLKSVAPSESDTIINGNNQTRSFTFDSGETNESVLKGFTIMNGWAVNGGGIACYGSNPTITNNIILDNYADDNGGGIFCERASPIIRRNIIANNETSESSGGGIYAWNDSHPIIENNFIFKNCAEGNGGGVEIHYFSNVKIIKNIIRDNWSNIDGGGVSCSLSKALIIDNIISKNSSSSGGGIFYGESNISCLRNIILYNKSLNGGGIYCGNGDTVLEDCIIYKNTANNGNDLIDGAAFCCGQQDTIPLRLFYSLLSQPEYCGINNNICKDPLFINPNPDPNRIDELIKAGDYQEAMNYLRECYSLQPKSPCIDAGSPVSPRDPDGTRADMGAIPYNQLRAFIRGDLNQDRKVNLADVVYGLDYLFAGGDKPKCLDAADVNDDGRVDLSDSIYLLHHLFNNKPIPPPFPEPGRDETEDDLGCREYE